MLLLAGRQELVRKVRAAVPPGGCAAAVRPGQVVVRGQVLPEPGSEFLHTEHVHVLGITKVVIPVETEGLGVRVQV